MIPLKDHNPTSRPSVVVPAIIGLNVIMFLLVQPTVRGFDEPDEVRVVKETNFTACRASIPYEITHGELVLDAALDGTLTGDRAFLTAGAQAGFPRTPYEDLVEPCEDKNVWLSILTSMFMHGGWFHIGFNMLFLWVFGNNIEDRLGRLRFIVFYLLAGVVATYAQALANPSSTVPLIGASGAVAGVLGAYLLLYPRARVSTLVVFGFIFVTEMPALVLLGLWFALQLFQGLGSVTGDAGGVAYYAHIGGFVAGLLLIKAFRPRPAQLPWA